MITLVFLMYFITGLQLLSNRSYKLFKAQIILQLIFILIVSLLVFKSYVTFGALNLTF